jgi:hypothetical protein
MFVVETSAEEKPVPTFDVVLYETGSRFGHLFCRTEAARRLGWHFRNDIRSLF